MPRVRKKCLEGHTARAVRSPADAKGAHGLWHTVATKYSIFSLTERTRLAHRLAKRCYFAPVGARMVSGLRLVTCSLGEYIRWDLYSTITPP